MSSRSGERVTGRGCLRDAGEGELDVCLDVILDVFLVVFEHYASALDMQRGKPRRKVPAGAAGAGGAGDESESV